MIYITRTLMSSDDDRVLHAVHRTRVRDHGPGPAVGDRGTACTAMSLVGRKAYVDAISPRYSVVLDFEESETWSLGDSQVGDRGFLARKTVP